MARKQFDTLPAPDVSARENAHVTRQIALENAVRRVAYADGESLLRVLWEDSTAAEDARIEAERLAERKVEDFLSSTDMDDIKADHKADVLRDAKEALIKVIGKWEETKSGDIDWRSLESDLIEALTD